jgi:hypothetical protein
MTTNTPTSTRPGGVTFVVVLGYIASIFIILNGILVMIDADTLGLQLVSGNTEDELIVVGIITIVLGAIGILLTGALARGRRVVRILFTIWIAFQIAAGLNSMFNHSGTQSSSGAVPVVFGIIILFLLFGSKADAFFDGE